MKKRIVIVFLCFLVLVMTFIAGSATWTEKDTLDQHQKYQEKNKCGEKEEEFCTHLPILSIHTNNQAIPGMEEDGSTIQTEIQIIDNKENGNHLNDKEKVNTLANIRYRGHSSLQFDKKGFLLKFIKEDGRDNEEKVMGMASNNEWVLHGPFIDKTLIRNYLWYNISRKIMDNAPESRFCELFIDGEYQGLYLMVEAPTKGEKGTQSRMPIKSYDKKSDYTSYIVRLDRGTNKEEKNLNTFGYYTYSFSSQFNIVYPGINTLTPKLKEYIEHDISKVEKALYSYDYDSEKYGYKKYLDTDSFVDYYIINEFTQNYDAARFSTYFYKDPDGKYKLFVWDFNNACNNYENEIDIYNLRFQYNPWFVMLLKDEDFTNRIISRYKYLRQHYLNEEYLMHYIDATIAYLGEAIDRNFEKWGYTFEEENGLLEPKTRNLKSYEEAVNQLKDFIKVRGRYLDETIETIKQFSAESQVKKYNH